MPKEKQFIACKNGKNATVKPFCEIKNMTDTTADLYFYGDIVSDWWGAWQDEDQYPDAIKNFLAEAAGRDLNIYINSGGGSVFAGIAIYNMLKRYQGKKHCYVDALAGSIASLLPFVDSDRPTIPKNAYGLCVIPTHNPIINSFALLLCPFILLPSGVPMLLLPFMSASCSRPAASPAPRLLRL